MTCDGGDAYGKASRKVVQCDIVINVPNIQYECECGKNKIIHCSMEMKVIGEINILKYNSRMQSG